MTCKYGYAKTKQERTVRCPTNYATTVHKPYTIGHGAPRYYFVRGDARTAREVTPVLNSWNIPPCRRIQLRERPRRKSFDNRISHGWVIYYYVVVVARGQEEIVGRDVVRFRMDLFRQFSWFVVRNDVHCVHYQTMTAAPTIGILGIGVERRA